MKSLSFKRNAKGFSLIELLIVLGIIAILLVAAFIVYPQVRDRNQANAEVTNLTTIKAATTNLYASKNGSYVGLTPAVAFQAKVYPSGMLEGATSPDAISSWGKDVSTAVGTDTRTFEVTYAEVPAGLCLNLASGGAANFKDITIEGTTVYTAGKFAPELAAAACGADDADKEIVFVSN